MNIPVIKVSRATVTMSSAMMATRVSILLLVTGLFAAMWSADSPVSPTESQLLARRTTSRHALIRTSVSSPARITVTTGTNEKSIPLPNGIAPGVYVVVNQTGAVDHLTIEPREARSLDQRRMPEQYVVHRGANRWHFVRVSAPVETLLARPATTVSTLH